MHDTYVRDIVCRTTAELLGTDPKTVTRLGSLRELPGFDSFRMVEIIEHLERRLAVEIEPEALIPANLMELDPLCSLFESAVAGRIASQ